MKRSLPIVPFFLLALHLSCDFQNPSDFEVPKWNINLTIPLLDAKYAFAEIVDGETIQIDSTDREFIVLNYKNNDKLYVPSDQIDRIQLYKSFQKEDPSLDTLGSQRWIKSKNRVKKISDTLDVKTILGAASLPSILSSAGGSECDILIAVTKSDETNMIACQIGHSLFKIPKKIEFCELPKTSTGKIQKFELRKIAKELN